MPVASRPRGRPACSRTRARLASSPSMTWSSRVRRRCLGSRPGSLAASAGRKRLLQPNRHLPGAIKPAGRLGCLYRTLAGGKTLAEIPLEHGLIGGNGAESVSPGQTQARPRDTLEIINPGPGSRLERARPQPGVVGLVRSTPCQIEDIEDFGRSLKSDSGCPELDDNIVTCNLRRAL